MSPDIGTTLLDRYRHEGRYQTANCFPQTGSRNRSSVYGLSNASSQPYPSRSSARRPPPARVANEMPLRNTGAMPRARPEKLCIPGGFEIQTSTSHVQEIHHPRNKRYIAATIKPGSLLIGDCDRTQHAATKKRASWLAFSISAKIVSDRRAANDTAQDRLEQPFDLPGSVEADVLRSTALSAIPASS